MRTTYRALAYLVMLLVAVQAAALAFGFYGLGSWIYSGNDMTKAVLEDNSSGVTGEVGLAVHSIVGQMVIPVVALVMLVLAFFARIKGGVLWAALILVDIILQVVLGIVSFGAPTLGILHGLNAFLILWLALMAVRAATRSTRPAEAPVAAGVQ